MGEKTTKKNILIPSSFNDEEGRRLCRVKSVSLPRER